MSAPSRQGRPEAAAAVWPWKDAARLARAEASRARRGGLLRGAVAAAVGGLLFVLGARVGAYAAWALGGLVATLALASPRGAYRRIDGLASLLGRGVGALLGWLLLAPFFYLVMAPFGLLRRALGGRDVLARRPDRTAPTYLVRREPGRDEPLEKPY